MTTLEDRIKEFKETVMEALHKGDQDYSQPPPESLGADMDDAKLIELMSGRHKISQEELQAIQKRLLRDPTAPPYFVQAGWQHNGAPSMMGAWNGKISNVRINGTGLEMDAEFRPLSDEQELGDTTVRWDLKSYDEEEADLIWLTLPAGIGIEENSQNLMLLKEILDNDSTVVLPQDHPEFFTLDKIIHLLPNLSPEKQEKWIPVIDQQAKEMEARAAALRIASMVLKTKMGKLPPNSP